MPSTPHHAKSMTFKLGEKFKRCETCNFSGKITLKDCPNELCFKGYEKLNNKNNKGNKGGVQHGGSF